MTRKTLSRILGTAFVAAALVAVSGRAEAYAIKKSRVPDVCENEPDGQLLACYLSNMPQVAQQLEWVFAGASPPVRAWAAWPKDLKGALKIEFDLAMEWHSPRIILRPQNGLMRRDYLHRFEQPLPKGEQAPNVSGVRVSESVARRIYLSWVANGLAAEITGRFGWSIATYTPEQLRQLFNYFSLLQYVSSSKFPGWYTKRNISPANATYVVEFMHSNDLIEPTALETVARVVEWTYSMEHYFTSTPGEWPDPTHFWGPTAMPAPYSLIVGGYEYSGPLGGFEGKRHWTKGCSGTTEFYQWTLRAVNLPVKDVTAGNPAVCFHRTPYFMTIDRYLSHGDDPYNAYMHTDPPVPGLELLLTGAEFATWFPPAADDPDGAICEQNVGCRPSEIAVEYLTDYLVYQFCHDVLFGESHADGQVFATLGSCFTLDELEAMDLWASLALQAQVTGACNP